MHSIRRLGTVLAALAGLLSLPTGRAEALTAATGTVNVMVVANPLFPAASTITITATFDDATYDLPGVNLGDSLGSVSATSVALTNVALGTGAHFVIPFKDTGVDAFEAAGDIACPADGCISPTPAERYGFVGFLQNVEASVGLPADNVYTFDGSASCSLGGVTLTCNGPFSLNAFPVDDVLGGSPTATVERTVMFMDPTPPGGEREFKARVDFGGVTTGGMVSITGLSRYRGSIPAGYALSSGAFRALYFDIESDVVATSRRACVEVDANLDGFVDIEPTLTLPQLAILHATAPGNPFAAVPLVFLPPFVCADVISFSPFVLLVDPTPPTTTTTIEGGGTTSTTLPPGASTTTTIASTGTTSTTLQVCKTARECLQQTKTRPLCGETINPKLQSTITKKTAAAETKLGKAANATTTAKAARFQKQAKAAINAILKKADAFVTKKKGPISSACRDAIKKALQPVISQIDGSQF